MNAPLPLPLPREALLARAREDREWDLVVVGGGCVGLGIALDAAARGFSVALVESHDFAGGTSSRATKLAHGGVRYLAQGDFALVREALVERAAMLANAPHVAQRIGFVMPGYHWWERGFYGLGLKAYDALAGAHGLGGTEWLSSGRTLELLPGVARRGLWGGVRYWDGQFDDARFALLLARAAALRGALVINHAPVETLLHERGQVRGVVARDAEAGAAFTLRGRCVINATGVWVDTLRTLDHEAGEAAVRPPPMVAPSQGVHLVVDRAFLPGSHALLVPKTADGRVLFAVPWLGKTVLGTTDTPRADLPREPEPLAGEVRFILDEAARYLERAPRREDVRSVWVGLRPLVRDTAAAGEDTKLVSREHTVRISRTGLVTVTGGKWTTYRAMAEDVLARAMARGLLPRRPAGVTARLALPGAAGATAQAGPRRPVTEAPGEHLYGSEAEALRTLPGAERWLAHDEESGFTILSEAMVRFAARHEMARTVEDVLARRCRLLFLDAAQAARAAPAVARVLGEELRRETESASFEALAAQYQRLP